MKLRFLLLFVVGSFLLFSCANHEPQIQNDKNIHSIWAGSFTSDYHSHGVITSWVLYNDGTMTGKWKTHNNSIVINLKGNYSVTGKDVSFQGTGDSLIRSKIKTKVYISGDGEVNKMHAKGVFKISIDHPKFPNDTGTWSMERL